MSDIKPILDEHGVGWCSPECPRYERGVAVPSCPGQGRSEICEPWARRMVEERNAWIAHCDDESERGYQSKQRLRRVQRAARKWHCKLDGDDLGPWWKLPRDNRPGVDACWHCYRAMAGEECGRCE